MRIDKGHRDFRDIYLRAHVLSLLSRAHNNRQYGNPFVQINQEVASEEGADALRKSTDRLQSLHRSTARGRNFYRLKSANHGFTVAIKDNILTSEIATTCASRILKGLRPREKAAVAKRLELAGMVTVGTTNMDEFGMGSHTTHSTYGPSFNGMGLGIERKDSLSVGGSSGGSALAVARDLAHVGIGTDTGGSIRLPAAYLSLVGFKPSYGMISRTGVVPYANSLDTVGILAKTALDIRLTYAILRATDDRDPTCLDLLSRTRIIAAKNKRRRHLYGSKLFLRRVLPYDSNTKKPTEIATRRTRARNWNVMVSQQYTPRRVGVPLEYNIEEMHPLVRWAWTATLSHIQKEYKCEIVPISLPSTRHALSAYYVLAPAEAASNLAKYDGVRYGHPRGAPLDTTGTQFYTSYRYKNFGPEVKRRILLGTYSLSAGAMDNYFIQAQKVRRLVQQDFDAVFRMPNPLRDDSKVNPDGVDVILVPTAPTPPPFLGTLKHQSPVQRYMNDVFTVPASLAGLPAISVPAPAHPDHPWHPEVAVGMQVIGQYGDDYSVIYFAQNFLSRFHRPNIRRLKDTKLFK